MSTMEAQRNRWEIQHNIKVCNHDNDNRFDGKTQNQPLARFNVYVYKANYDLTPMPRRVSTTLKKRKREKAHHELEKCSVTYKGKCPQVKSSQEGKMQVDHKADTHISQRNSTSQNPKVQTDTRRRWICLPISKDTPQNGQSRAAGSHSCWRAGEG